MATTKELAIIISAKNTASSVFAKLEQTAYKIASPLNAFAEGLFKIQGRIGKFFDAGIFKLTSLGGAYNEQRTQFDNLAAAMGKSGQDILDVVDNIGQGTVKAGDQVKIATKAISSGLSGPDMEAALAFTKRFTEATGQGFAGMAESVFAAFNSGRTGILRQMGLFIEDGASAGEIMAQIRNNLDLFGQAGFNTGDIIGKINAKISDFVTFIGQAINNTQSWQRFMEYIGDTVEDFVKGFDFTRVGYFFEAIVAVAGTVYDVLAETFSGVGKYISETFQRLATSSGAREFFVGFAQAAAETFGQFVAKAGQAGKFFTRFVQNLSNAVSNVVGVFGWLVESVGEAWKAIDLGAISVGQTINNVITRAIAGAAQALLELVQSSPILQNAWGMDAIANGISNLQVAAARSNREFAELRRQAEAGAGELSFLERFGQGAQDLARKLALDSTEAEKMIDDAAGWATDVADRINEALGTIEFVEFEPPTGAQANKAKAAFAALEAARAQAEEAAAKDREKKAEDQRKKELQEEPKAFDDRKRLLTERLKDINDLLKEAQFKEGEGGFKILGFDVAALQQEKTQIEKIISEISKAEADARKKAVAGLLTAPQNLQIKAEIDPITNKLISGIQKGKLDVKHEMTARKLDVTVRGADWQGALQQIAAKIIEKAIIDISQEGTSLVAGVTVG